MWVFYSCFVCLLIFYFCFVVSTIHGTDFYFCSFCYLVFFFVSGNIEDKNRKFLNGNWCAEFFI